MSRGKPNKRYTPEFKKLVVETMMKEKLGYRETARRFEVRGAQQIINWERTYLAEARRHWPSTPRPRQQWQTKEAAERGRRRSASRSSATACGE
nr:hypothetical protein [Butyricicoccus sp. OF13-6]